VTGDLVLPDAAPVADLTTYVARAKRVDPDGAVRLVASGAALAAYVSPVHGSGGPTVLGLRVLPLGQPADVDTTVALSAVADRLARLEATGSGGGPVRLAIPPVQVKDASWAGVSPPRAGWQQQGALERSVLDAVAREGVAEISAGAPEGSGASAVGRLRGLVWGREVPGAWGLAAGAAFVADALGFLAAADEEPIVLYAHGAWRRLTTSRGHVLCRRSLL
jgi:hypothetical protein